MKQDNVNHPKHYNSNGIECIEAIKASMTTQQFNGYLKGNIIKYLWRFELKNNPTEDLEKAQWYLNRLIQETEANNNMPVIVSKINKKQS